MNLSGVCKSKLSWGMVCLLILSAGSRTTLGSPSFTGLGDLPGSDFESQAYSVSSDGSVVVGKGSVEGRGRYGCSRGRLQPHFKAITHSPGLSTPLQFILSREYIMPTGERVRLFRVDSV